MTDQGLFDCFALLLGMFAALAFIAGSKAGGL